MIPSHVAPYNPAESDVRIYVVPYFDDESIREYEAGHILMTHSGEFFDAEIEVMSYLRLENRSFGKYGNLLFCKELPEIFATFSLSDPFLQQFLKSNHCKEQEITKSRNIKHIEGKMRFHTMFGNVVKVNIYCDPATEYEMEFDKFAGKYTFEYIPSWNECLKTIWMYRQTEKAYVFETIELKGSLFRNLKMFLPFGWKIIKLVHWQKLACGPLFSSKEALSIITEKLVKEIPVIRSVVKTEYNVIPSATVTGEVLWKPYPGSAWTWKCCHGRILEIATAFSEMDLSPYVLCEIAKCIDKYLCSSLQFLIVKLLDNVINGSAKKIVQNRAKNKKDSRKEL